MARERNPYALWEAVIEAGGVDAYVKKQLTEKGFLVKRREIDTMSERERKKYKAELKKEAAEKKELRREAWEARKEAEILHLGENVYWCDAADFDRYDHKDAEERQAENDIPRLDKPRQLAEFLGVTIQELRWFCFHREAARMVHYERFTIEKRDGSERAIWAPRKRLKAMQRKVLREIVERLPVHGAAHGFLPGRSILTHAEQHTDAKLVVQMDVKDFFPSVTMPRVKGIFRQAGYREQVATLLALLCTEAPREIVEKDGVTYYVAMGPRCLPQGAPTSPALTNTLCLRLDRRLAGLASKLGWRYSRYADDLTFSLPTDHKGKPRTGLLIGGAGRIVADEGFAVHPKKTRVSRTGSRQKVTGLIVNGDGVPRTPREMRRRLRAAIHNLKNGKGLQDGETLETLKGYASFVHMTDPELGRQWLKELDDLSETV